ncbi:MAG: DivIVA domain-containing protein [Micrococcales bacterium]|nr:DivIVA domain-containing protein [Micrococcales bacterium]NBR61219.1 DivIVA domain-containing protein [Actinomycetota bacterium]NBT47174.1 DivIVA domain-containing protein [Actinomycetota bacterium]NBY43463.1 DivIVA domain-containing protein [Micrococcales bacterium]
MTEKFPRAKKLGYAIDEVNVFLDKARVQYLNPEQLIIDTQTLRATRFKLVKHGYSISAVDAALEKLEDVFASRELEAKLRELGFNEFLAELNQIKQLIDSRLVRPKRKRFARRGWPFRGYDRKQVDALCSRVATHVKAEAELTVRDVRIEVFKSKRGGYAEHQVDAFMDKVVELLQRQKIFNG